MVRIVVQGDGQTREFCVDLMRLKQAVVAAEAISSIRELGPTCSLSAKG